MDETGCSPVRPASRSDLQPRPVTVAPCRPEDETRPFVVRPACRLTLQPRRAVSGAPCPGGQVARRPRPATSLPSLPPRPQSSGGLPASGAQLRPGDLGVVRVRATSRPDRRLRPQPGAGPAIGAVRRGGSGGRPSVPPTSVSDLQPRTRPRRPAEGVSHWAQPIRRLPPRPASGGSRRLGDGSRGPAASPVARSMLRSHPDRGPPVRPARRGSRRLLGDPVSECRAPSHPRPPWPGQTLATKGRRRGGLWAATRRLEARSAAAHCGRRLAVRMAASPTSLVHRVGAVDPRRRRRSAPSELPAGRPSGGRRATLRTARTPPPGRRLDEGHRRDPGCPPLRTAAPLGCRAIRHRGPRTRLRADAERQARLARGVGRSRHRRRGPEPPGVARRSAERLRWPYGSLSSRSSRPRGAWARGPTAMLAAAGRDRHAVPTTSLATATVGRPVPQVGTAEPRCHPEVDVTARIAVDRHPPTGHPWRPRNR